MSSTARTSRLCEGTEARIGHAHTGPLWAIAKGDMLPPWTDLERIARSETGHTETDRNHTRSLTCGARNGTDERAGDMNS